MTTAIEHLGIDPGNAAGPWNAMATAPRDGTEIILLLHHTYRRYARTSAEQKMWEQEVPAKWIDFNGGGWTWRGMAGTPIAWKEISHG